MHKLYVGLVFTACSAVIDELSVVSLQGTVQLGLAGAVRGAGEGILTALTPLSLPP